MDNTRDYAFAFDDCGQQLHLLEHVAVANTGFRTTSSQATPACLIPFGQTKPLKLATSGWRSAGPSGDILDNEKWTSLVRSFCTATGFHLRWSIRDTPYSPKRVYENDGRYFACHTEKKLGLYFLAEQMKFARMSLEEALTGKLCEANLSLRRRRALIVLGRKPCKSCLDFLKIIRKRTGLVIQTKQCPVYKPRIRQSTFFRGQNHHGPINSRPGKDEAASITGDAKDIHNGGNSVIIIPDEDEEGQMDKGQRGLEHQDIIENRDKISLLSTPSPAIPASSMFDSVRNSLANMQYCTPSHSGGRGTAPSVWGNLGKPQPTPCMNPPDFLPVGSCNGSGRIRILHSTNTSIPTSLSHNGELHETSYFFDTGSRTGAMAAWSKTTERGKQSQHKTPRRSQTSHMPCQHTSSQQTNSVHAPPQLPYRTPKAQPPSQKPLVDLTEQQAQRQARSSPGLLRSDIQTVQPFTWQPSLPSKREGRETEVEVLYARPRSVQRRTKTNVSKRFPNLSKYRYAVPDWV